jgi:uncharacterized membrane protein YfcA
MRRNRVAPWSPLRFNTAVMTLIADPLFYLAAIPAVIFLGLSKGGFSGIGMISTPLLALILPPLEAAAILLPIILLQDAISVWVYRRVWDPWNLKVMVPGCLIGVGAAWLFAAYVSTGAIRLAVGLIALGFVGYTLFRHYLPAESRKPKASHGVFWGGLSGFTTTLIQIGAPPYYAFVLPQRLPKMIYVGTTVMFFAAANVMKIAPYFALGQFSLPGLTTSLALFPLAIATNFLGIWLVRITPEAMFYRITNVIVFLLGLELTRQGIVELVA